MVQVFSKKEQSEHNLPLCTYLYYGIFQKLQRNQEHESLFLNLINKKYLHLQDLQEFTFLSQLHLLTDLNRLSYFHFSIIILVNQIQDNHFDFNKNHLNYYIIYLQLIVYIDQILNHLHYNINLDNSPNSQFMNRHFDFSNENHLRYI